MPCSRSRRPAATRRARLAPRSSWQARGSNRLTDRLAQSLGARVQECAVVDRDATTEPQVDPTFGFLACRFGRRPGRQATPRDKRGDHLVDDDVDPGTGPWRRTPVGLAQAVTREAIARVPAFCGSNPIRMPIRAVRLVAGAGLTVEIGRGMGRPARSVGARTRTIHMACTRVEPAPATDKYRLSYGGRNAPASLMTTVMERSGNMRRSPVVYSIVESSTSHR